MSKFLAIELSNERAKIGYYNFNIQISIALDLNLPTFEQRKRMENGALMNLSPIDGRYQSKCNALAPFLSEHGLFHYRLKIEIAYLIALNRTGIKGFEQLSKKEIESIEGIDKNFSLVDSERIKSIEKTTNHDVKAVEYFLKEKFSSLGLEHCSEFIHFGLTSQDINNTATPLSIKAAEEEVMVPKLKELLAQLQNREESWRHIPMLARTHGQPASPTRLGKEISVFRVRLEKQLSSLEAIPYPAKFGGATGNFNAHHFCYPETDWHQFADKLMEELNLQRSFPSTQIEHYDFLAARFQTWSRINTILIDFAQDIWTYISLDYFKQKIKKGEIGSSAMPHKVNPIDFENAEGNLGLANAQFNHLANKLPISRLQRDLTDSTVLRSLSLPYGHTLIALSSLIKGIEKLELHNEKLETDLNNNWAVVAEGIQNLLRSIGFPKPYEALLELTRKNEKITESSIKAFIEGLDIDENIRERLLKISPHNYLGPTPD